MISLLKFRTVIVTDRLVADEKEGVSPVHIPKDWCPVERRQKKSKKE